MAAKKRASLFDPDDLLPTADEAEFEEFLETVGPGTSSIDIFRTLRDGSRGHLDRVGLEVIQEDVFGYLRENFGPGKYQLYFKGADKRYKGAKTLNIADVKALPAPGAAAVQPGTADHTQVMREQMAMQQTLITSLIAAIKPPDLTPLLAVMNRPGPDPSAMLTAVVTAFSALRGPQKDEDWLTRAKTIIELAQDLKGDGAKEDTPWSVVKEVGREVFARLQPPQGNGNGSAVAQPGPTAEAVPAVTQGAPALTQETMGAWVQTALAYLKEKARRTTEENFKDRIELCVDWIMENAEEPQFQAILGAIQHGATFEQLQQFDKEIAQTPTLLNWFKALYDELHAQIFEPVDSARAGGHADNSTDNAGTGPRTSEQSRPKNAS